MRDPGSWDAYAGSSRSIEPEFGSSSGLQLNQKAAHAKLTAMLLQAHGTQRTWGIMPNRGETIRQELELQPQDALRQASHTAYHEPA